MAPKTAVAVLAAVMAGAPSVSAVDLKFFGSLGGTVRAGGVTQMGAQVLLVNRYERVLQKALTGPDGRFRFDSLIPDSYSVRVTLGSFIPAFRTSIPVRAGMESFLNIQLANLFSSVELLYVAPGQGVLSDDWKWTLRSSTATRPVLRYLPGLDPPWQAPRPKAPLLSAPSGLIRVSAGGQGLSSTLGNEPDLGTAFALATSLFGTSELYVSGNLGYATSVGTPTAGFRTRYSRGAEGSVLSPDVELTVRQAAVRTRAGQAMLIGGASPSEPPLLRTMSVKAGDNVRITEELSLEYGALLEAVVFVERLNLISPYARLNYDLGEAGLLELGYSSGAPALDLLGGPGETGAQDSLIGLAMFPRVSLAGGRARVQRSQTFEAGYQRNFGDRTVSVGVFREDMRDMAVTMSAPSGIFTRGDLLPDLASPSWIFNLGSWNTFGYMASVSQQVTEHWTAGLSAGASGMLAPSTGSLTADEASELRSIVRPVRRPWAAARISGQMPFTGTRVLTAYVWTPKGTMGPGHAWLTQSWQPSIGLNVQLRQPVPSGGLIPGRFEMTAELRNMLAQGYLPIAALSGRTVWLIQYPRVMRGGLSFIF